LVRELLLRFGRVARDTEDDDALVFELLELRKVVAKLAGLDGAAGGVGLGVEEEHDGFALEVRERDGVAVLVGRVKSSTRSPGCMESPSAIVARGVVQGRAKSFHAKFAKKSAKFATGFVANFALWLGAMAKRGRRLRR